jgi:uncharacterized membrane protein YqaE (UPF0057 family)
MNALPVEQMTSVHSVVLERTGSKLVKQEKELAKKADKEQKKMERKAKWLKRFIGDGITESDNKILAIILAILLPPIGVWFFEGEITMHFWLDLLLTFLFWIPGVIYALYIILR